MIKRFNQTLLWATVFACLGGVPLCASGDLTQMNVYPNPVRRYAGDTDLVFDNLTTQARIRIYTATGSLVREVHLEGVFSSYRWDLRNDSGNEVVSGVYVYLVTNGSGEKKSGKVIVIK